MANDEALDLELEQTGGEYVFDDYVKKVIEEQAVNTLANMYRQAYDDVEEYSRILKNLTKKKDAIGEQLCKVLLTTGLKSVKTEDGTFSPKKEECVSILAPEKAFEILEECGHGGAIKRKVEWQTLNKLYREDKTLIQAVAASDGVFKTWDKHTIRIRRAND